MLPTLSPQQFVDKWRKTTLRERAATQEHFIDLCRLIGHPTPAEADPAGKNFTFEAVLDAYGWPHDLSDEEIVERLLALNLERAEPGG